MSLSKRLAPSGQKSDPVWQYFDKIPPNSGKGCRAKCKQCQVELQGLVIRLRKHREKCQQAQLQMQVSEEEIEDDPASPISERSLCKYGTKCFRRNPSHFKEYSHPHLEEVLKADKSSTASASSSTSQHLGLAKEIFEEQLQIVRDILHIPHQPEPSDAHSLKQGRAATSLEGSSAKSEVKKLKATSSSSTSEKKADSTPHDAKSKWEAAAPYHFFLTKVMDSPTTHTEPLGIAFHELLAPSMGDLKESLQINFMVELDWLMYQYKIRNVHTKPMLILHGVDPAELGDTADLPSSVTVYRVKSPYPFGHHHTKMCLFQYSDGSMRVVVHTANLIESDWVNRTQGVWVSPVCTRLPSGPSATAGDSATQFKADLLKYLTFYKVQHLEPWIALVKSCDFSEIRVWLIASVPASHKESSLLHWGHCRLSSILRKHVPAEIHDWPVIIQCSSIGSLGPSPDLWFAGELGRSLAACGRMPAGKPDVKLLYPSHQNVADSYDGLLGGGCLPYSRKGHQKQTWLTGYMYQWKSDCRQRTRAMPHIKSYTRLSPDNLKIPWFLLTSANLSKAAWGMLSKNKSSHYIQSYEAGVLFLPKFFTGETTFDVGFGGKSDDQKFQVPYDLPPTKFRPSDSPWFMDTLRL